MALAPKWVKGLGQIKAYWIIIFIRLFYTFAQSICTHYFSLSGRPDIFLGSGTGKKSGPKKSRVQKNRVIVIQKEKRPDCLFSFWITTTRFFCTQLFFGPDLFSGSQTDPCFQNKNSGCRLTGRLEWPQIKVWNYQSLAVNM